MSAAEYFLNKILFPVLYDIFINYWVFGLMAETVILFYLFSLADSLMEKSRLLGIISTAAVLAAAGYLIRYYYLLGHNILFVTAVFLALLMFYLVFVEPLIDKDKDDKKEGEKKDISD